MEKIFQYGLLLFFVGAILLTMWNDRKEDKRRKMEMNKKPATPIQLESSTVVENSKMGTRDLFLDSLTKIGCQYKLGEGEDDRIFFDYQGEHFFADTTNENAYVHIWDTHWGHIDLSDIDEVSRLRKAINVSNLNAIVTTVFTIDEDGKNMYVHSERAFPFISSMPKLEVYLRAELSCFFHAHKLVGTEMHKLREQDQNA